MPPTLPIRDAEDFVAPPAFVVGSNFDVPFQFCTCLLIWYFY